MNRNIRIGIFTAIGVALIIGFSVFVNDHPYWYSPCNLVKIHVDDATGLRRKSPVKTLGLEIGYIHDVNLDGAEVMITVCVTGPVTLVPETRAYIRSAGFLGDKFLELKPVDMISQPHKKKEPTEIHPEKSSSPPATHDSQQDQPHAILNSFLNLFESSAMAADEADIPEVNASKTLSASRDTELQDMMKKATKLMDQLSLMVGDLREVTQQKQFKETIINLNGVLKNLHQITTPDGKIVKNLDGALDSMRAMMEQANSVMQKINSNNGTLGKLINDTSIYDEMKAAIQSINLLLGKAGKLKTFVDLSAVNIPAYDGYRGALTVMIQPNPTRYYLIGIANDTLGKTTKTTTTTSVNGASSTVVTQSLNEEKGLRVTALFGKYFGPLELKAGIILDDGAVGVGYWFDPDRRFGIQVEGYSPGKGQGFTARAYARAQIYSSVYVTGGIDSLTKYNGKSTGYFGAGVSFDDDDLKYLLVFK